MHVIRTTLTDDDGPGQNMCLPGTKASDVTPHPAPLQRLQVEQQSNNPRVVRVHTVYDAGRITPRSGAHVFLQVHIGQFPTVVGGVQCHSKHIDIGTKPSPRTFHFVY